MKAFVKSRIESLKSGKLWNYVRYSIGEIILIAIGIMIAFQLTSWDEDRKLRRTEIATLREIKKALITDRIDLRFNIRLYTKVSNSCDTIVAMLDDKIPHDPIYNKYFSGPNLVPVFFSNTGAYETLKSKGIEVIANDTLRKAMINLYDRTYLGLHKFESHLIDYVLFVEKEFYPSHFDQSFKFSDAKEILGMVTPNDFAELKQNKQFRHHMLTIKNKTDFFVFISAAPTLKALERLIDRVDKEISRLENK